MTESEGPAQDDGAGDVDSGEPVFVTFRHPVMVRVMETPVPILAMDAQEHGAAATGVRFISINLYRIPSERVAGMVTGSPVKIRVKMIVPLDNIAGVVQQAPLKSKTK